MDKRVQASAPCSTDGGDNKVLARKAEMGWTSRDVRLPPDPASTKTKQKTSKKKKKKAIKDSLLDLSANQQNYNLCSVIYKCIKLKILLCIVI